MGRLITLTTDFGLKDGFVGALKGAILSINPNATIVDIAHEIAPQNVEEGAFVFAAAAKYFPPDTIHIVVVDPGVGSARRAIAVQAGETIFVAPDNGVLTFVIASEAKTSPQPSPCEGEGKGGVEIASGQSPPLAMTIRAFHLNKQEYWLPHVSNTFHGRDIFAPVAAHLSLGIPLDALGEPIADLARLPARPPETRPDGTIVGRVIHVDRFGNLITNISAELLAPRDPSRVVVEIAGQTAHGLKKTYAEGARGEAIALIGSSGLLEVAIREASAAEKFDAGTGTLLTVR